MFFSSFEHNQDDMLGFCWSNILFVKEQHFSYVCMGHEDDMPSLFINSYLYYYNPSLGHNYFCVHVWGMCLGFSIKVKKLY